MAHMFALVNCDNLCQVKPGSSQKLAARLHPRCTPRRVAIVSFSIRGLCDRVLCPFLIFTFCSRMGRVMDAVNFLVVGHDCCVVR